MIAPRNFASHFLGGMCLVIFMALSSGCGDNSGHGQKNAVQVGSDGVYHAYPKDDLQTIIDAAALNQKQKTVIVHEGTYFPRKPGQALIWFNRTHDGVKLKAEGRVILTAANAELAPASSPTFPAIVNHVVYFGHGISSETKIDGIEITGANNVISQEGVITIEPDLPESLKPGLFFFSDGGAIKVYGDSAPQLLNLKIIDNVAKVCGGGISVEHRGSCRTPVLIKNCIFKNNRCGATGSAVDLLEGSRAVIDNCLFENNVGNYAMDSIARLYGLRYNERHGSGALTVFPKSTVTLKNCTFVNNWNGVDDHGEQSTYSNSLFWKNTNSDGSRPGKPYELDTVSGIEVKNCYIHGGIVNLSKEWKSDQNTVEAFDPDFDSSFRPQNPKLQGVGYRPVSVEEEK